MYMCGAQEISNTLLMKFPMPNLLFRKCIIYHKQQALFAALYVLLECHMHSEYILHSKGLTSCIVWDSVLSCIYSWDASITQIIPSINALLLIVLLKAHLWNWCLKIQLCRVQHNPGIAGRCPQQPSRQKTCLQRPLTGTITLNPDPVKKTYTTRCLPMWTDRPGEMICTNLQKMTEKRFAVICSKSKTKAIM